MWKEYLKRFVVVIINPEGSMSRIMNLSRRILIAIVHASRLTAIAIYRRQGFINVLGQVMEGNRRVLIRRERRTRLFPIRLPAFLSSCTVDSVMMFVSSDPESYRYLYIQRPYAFTGLRSASALSVLSPMRAYKRQTESQAY
ncbi:hypothetical protein K443DRAFT_325188 [Laccaria amethystina LaAM-08-1]|uniref:Uncharacterized protein n=1 Tax=Laccaria amethystina LaAM-08-1 TaxID=1095629 RepID=A0A0C9WTV9_9AGAR|nr:hypothetical protein K443DRAFT_325188 [Laccaria amethystina LaAM-08-1]